MKLAYLSLIPLLPGVVGVLLGGIWFEFGILCSLGLYSVLQAGILDDIEERVIEPGEDLDRLRDRADELIELLEDA